MARDRHFDVIVIGGGPIGLSAAYHCAKAARSVLVLERFNFFNQSGSSNDLVRMFRTMYTQDFMADLAHASIRLWRDLERESGERLIEMTGLLNFGDPKYDGGPEGTLLAPIPNLERLKMPYRLLSAAEIEAEYPLKNLPSTFQGIFAPDNGCINVPLVLRTLHRLAQSYGATMRSHARVRDVQVGEDGVRIGVEGDEDCYTADKIIVAAGAYTNPVLHGTGVALKLSIWEMVYEYYASDPGPDGAFFPSMWFQFMDPTGGDPARSNLFYGFPSVPWGPPNLVRIAVDNAVNVITDPDERQIAPSANDLSITADFVDTHVVGVDTRPNFCGTCLQTNVADNMYVLDFLPPTVPGYRNVALFTAGWAFKLTPLIGQVLGELVMDGASTFDISQFSITRPGVLS